MPSGPLFRRHPLPIQTSYSDLKQNALDQVLVFEGTPGSVLEREVHGRKYLYRKYYDAKGSQQIEHIGPADDADARHRAEALRERIVATNDLLKSVRFVGQLGYARTDAATEALLGAFANAGLFRAGAIVIGSNAYGALLNDLGAAASAFATQDVDLVRPQRLVLRGDSLKTFEEILASSGLILSPIPSFNPKKPETGSFKASGKSTMKVDLLVPTNRKEVEIKAVPELRTHAQALPYLQYLLVDPFPTVALGRSGIVPIKVPRPERFAWHKMLTSELRNEATDKKRKDLDQAATLFAVLAEDAPAALEDARAALPKVIVGKVRRAAAAVEARLVAGKHERAVELLRELL